MRVPPDHSSVLGSLELTPVALDLRQVMVRLLVAAASVAGGTRVTLELVAFSQSKKDTEANMSLTCYLHVLQ